LSSTLVSSRVVAPLSEPAGAVGYRIVKSADAASFLNFTSSAESFSEPVLRLLRLRPSLPNELFFTITSLSVGLLAAASKSSSSRSFFASSFLSISSYSISRAFFRFSAFDLACATFRALKHAYIPSNSLQRLKNL